MGIKYSHILYLDDDESILEIMGRTVEGMSSCYYPVQTIAEANTVLEEVIPHLIIVDVKLANENGLSFVKELYFSKRFKDVPVIVVSALKENKIQKIMNGLGNPIFIGKPFNMREITEQFNKILKNKRVLTVKENIPVTIKENCYIDSFNEFKFKIKTTFKLVRGSSIRIIADFFKKGLEHDLESYDVMTDGISKKGRYESIVNFNNLKLNTIKKIRSKRVKKC
jgi:response regulator RpfG family c-di-GMP phosphodiesterase